MMESSGDPESESRVAVGLAQLIESAAKDCRRQGGLKGRRKDVRFSLGCGAYLTNRNRKIWKAKRTEECRYNLTLASYISGAGNIIKAQTKARTEGYAASCLGNGIQAHLSKVISEKNAKDVEYYVKRIHELAAKMEIR